jgi:dTMP kinase
MFLVIEGLDGSGGTTQLRMLVSILQKLQRDVVATAEPSSGPVGKLIRSALVEGTVSEAVLPYLFCADRKDHLERVIQPARARGAWVISDRYLHSSLAYQSAILPMERVDVLNADFRTPDATIYLDVPVEECLVRIERRGLVREIFETRERLLKIEAAYSAALALRRNKGDQILTVAGCGDPAEVHDRVVVALKSVHCWPG